MKRAVLAGRAFVAVLLLCAAACGGSPSGSTAPSPSSFAGNWLGTLTAGPPATLRMTVNQSDDALSGTWAMTAQDGIRIGVGTLSGRALGTTMAIVLSWSGSTTNCPLNVWGTLNAAGTEMTGSYGAATCGNYTNSTGFTAIRQ